MNSQASLGLNRRNSFPLPLLFSAPSFLQKNTFEKKLWAILISHTRKEKAIEELAIQVAKKQKGGLPEEVIDTLEKLVDFYPHDIMLFLSYLVKNANSQLAWFAAQELIKLAKIYPASVTRIIEQLLKIPPRQVRAKIIYLLSAYIHTFGLKGMHLIETALNSTYEDVQWSAASLLAELEKCYPEQVEKILEKLIQQYQAVQPSWFALLSA